MITTIPSEDSIFKRSSSSLARVLIKVKSGFDYDVALRAATCAMRQLGVRSYERLPKSLEWMRELRFVRRWRISDSELLSLALIAMGHVYLCESKGCDPACKEEEQIWERKGESLRKLYKHADWFQITADVVPTKSGGPMHAVYTSFADILHKVPGVKFADDFAPSYGCDKIPYDHGVWAEIMVRIMKTASRRFDLVHDAVLAAVDRKGSISPRPNSDWKNVICYGWIVAVNVEVYRPYLTSFVVHQFLSVSTEYLRRGEPRILRPTLAYMSSLASTHDELREALRVTAELDPAVKHITDSLVDLDVARNEYINIVNKRLRGDYDINGQVENAT